MSVQYYGAVKFQVYRLRDNGERLHGDVIERRGPAMGELIYKQRVTRSEIFCAALFAEDMCTYVVPLLDRARLLQMTPKGMMLIGIEVIPRGTSIKASADYYRQSWWCLPVE